MPLQDLHSYSSHRSPSRNRVAFLRNSPFVRMSEKGHNGQGGLARYICTITTPVSQDTPRRLIVQRSAHRAIISLPQIPCRQTSCMKHVLASLHLYYIVFDRLRLPGFGFLSGLLLISHSRHCRIISIHAHQAGTSDWYVYSGLDIDAVGLCSHGEE